MANLTDYYEFTSRSRINKSINSLLGIVEGIAIDGVINHKEVSFLSNWISEHYEYRDFHPYNELLPVVAKALQDGILTEEERLDIKWLCDRLRSTEYYDLATADLQRLHAIIGGVSSDGVITEDELRNLLDWLQLHDHLRTLWPFDEVDSLIVSIMADNIIDPEEHHKLLTFFGQFVDIGDHNVIPTDAITVQGICAVCPEIVFSGSLFCFTGESERYTREELHDKVLGLGGRVTNGISKKLNYLIIGAKGNPCWAYACYGRKVEAAVNLRRQGHRLLLVNEYDFNDAIS
jgi:hypothetical protein